MPTDRRAEHLAGLYEISQTITSSLDLDEVLNLVMDKVIEVSGAQRGFLMLQDHSGQLAFQVARGIEGRQIDDPESGVSRGIIESVARSGQPLLTSNAQYDERLSGRDSIVIKGLRSVLCVPLVVKGRFIGLVYVDNQVKESIFGAEALELLTSFASQAAIAIENARLYGVAVEKGRMERELQMARDIQRSLLPAAPPRLPGYDMAADWRSAREVAGDFYDFIALDDGRLGVVIADVSDKGAPAALFMAVARSLIRANAMNAPTPAEALRRANRLIVADAKSGMFVTAYYVILTAGGACLGVCAGHNPPLIYRAASRTVEALPAGGLALGWFDDAPLSDAPVALGPDDVLLLYTDGAPDAENAKGEAFGDERMRSTLKRAAGGTAAEILQYLVASIAAFAGDTPAFDDQTFVVIKRVRAGA